MLKNKIKDFRNSKRGRRLDSGKCKDCAKKRSKEWSALGKMSKGFCWCL